MLVGTSGNGTSGRRNVRVMPLKDVAISVFLSASRNMQPHTYSPNTAYLRAGMQPSFYCSSCKPQSGLEGALKTT